MTPACPTAEALRRLGNDSLDDAAFRSIESHVAACPECQGRLEDLVHRETSAPAPRRAFPPSPVCPQIPGFRFRGELGRGGSGVVYEALQLAIGRPVAIKVLSSGASLDASARQRWLREARALGRIRHPNVVRLHDAGEHADRLYLVLDLIAGGSLRSALTGPLSPRHAATLVETISRAVEELHRAGLLHLDIKPSNILLDGPPDMDWTQRAPMLTDFGIALALDEEGNDQTGTGTHGACGTPAFMAPEQIVGRKRAIGPTADVFAIGATLYMLLTGRPPFQAATPIETLDLLRSRDPTPPRTLIPGLPRDLETVCLACLQKDPARRYPTAATLADDLRRWLDGYPIRARPATRAEQMLRWCVRHPAPAALASTLAATILAAVIVLAASWRQTASQRDRAEEALTRAQRGETAAREAVGDMVRLLRQDLEAPEDLVSERIDRTLAGVLGLTANLRRTPDLASAHAAAIADLELRLAKYIRRRSPDERIRRLLDDAIDLLALYPDRIAADVEAACHYADALLNRAAELAATSRIEESIQDFERASAAAYPHIEDPRAVDILSRLFAAKHGVADALEAQGRSDRATSMRKASRESIRELTRRFPDDPLLKVLEVLIDCQSTQSTGTIERITSAMRMLPSGIRAPRAMVQFADDLIARELCDWASCTRSRALTPSQTARHLMDRLAACARLLRRDEPDDSGVVIRLAERGSVVEIAERRGGNIVEARRTVAWMRTLADELQHRGSAAAGSHFLRSRALQHEAKLAWIVPDRAEAERCVRAALREAAIASRKSPDDERLRQHLAGLREKYVLLGTDELGD